MNRLKKNPLNIKVFITNDIYNFVCKKCFGNINQKQESDFEARSLFKYYLLLFGHLSLVRFFCDPMDCSPPGSSVHGLPWQEYWSGLPFSSLGDLFNPGIEPMSLALAAGFFTAEPPGKPLNIITSISYTLVVF